MAKAIKMTASKIKTCRAINANLGVEAWYRRKMNKAIEKMVNSAEYWLRAAYNQNPSEYSEQLKLTSEYSEVPMLSQDASPIKEIISKVKDMGYKWSKRFDDYAPVLAEAYAKKAFQSTDNSFRQALKDAGWSVDFKMTKSVRQALDAVMFENVSLIKSIPENYFNQIEGIIMRAYASGHDVNRMVEELKSMYPVTQRRAELIARDQTNKANSVVTNIRRVELGITEAIWQHSHAGKNPRPDHVAANGKRFKISEGCYISGKYILPGEEINCRCTSKSVLPY